MLLSSSHVTALGREGLRIVLLYGSGFQGLLFFLFSPLLNSIGQHMLNTLDPSALNLCYLHMDLNVIPQPNLCYLHMDLHLVPQPWTVICI